MEYNSHVGSALKETWKQHAMHGFQVQRIANEEKRQNIAQKVNCLCSAVGRKRKVVHLKRDVYVLQPMRAAAKQGTHDQIAVPCR